MNEKTAGTLLLILGILVMTASVGYVWLVFTGSIDPVSVIQAKPLTLDYSQILGDVPGSTALTQSTGGMELFSGQDLSKTLNLSITFFLMTFVMLFGFRIASLGVMLMRPIVVKTKETQEVPSQKPASQNSTGTSS